MLCGHRWSRDPVTNAVASFLDQVHRTDWPWDWFATFSFAEDEISPAGGQYLFRRFLDAMRRTAATQPYAFRVDEYGPIHGRYHMHALIGNVAHLTRYCGALLPPGILGERCCWMHRWPCGIARIYPFDPTLGAHMYLSKYVVKQIADWELVGFHEGLVFGAPSLRGQGRTS